MGQKLNPEMKAEWLAALRSGKYRQGAGTMCRVDDGVWRYCCLGVAAHLLATKGKGYVEEVRGSYARYGTPAMRATNNLNSALPEDSGYYEWTGLGNANPNVDLTQEESDRFRALRDEPAQPNHTLTKDLAQLNDTEFTFAQIADIIEREL